MQHANYSLSIPSASLPVSLLVPNAVLVQLRLRLQQQNISLCSLLCRLLQLAIDDKNCKLPVASGVNTLYQQAGLGLARLNARLPASVWCQLRCLARSRGVSICYLFVFLLQQDRENEETVGTPPLEQVQFQEILDLTMGIVWRKLRIELQTPE